MAKQIKAIARVQVVVEVDASCWGEDCSIGQLFEQAATEGVRRVSNKLNKAECRHTIIGEPKVIGVLTERP